MSHCIDVPLQRFEETDMKYIDAEKLVAEIERQRVSFEYNGKTPDERAWRCFGELISFISSLPQEQPSLPSNLNEAAEEYLEQYNESEFGNGGDDWDDDIRITFKAGAEWMARQTKQEQPEVDLEKEIRSMWELCEPIDEGMGVESAYMHIEAFDIIARQFYELGLKARKEK